CREMRVHAGEIRLGEVPARDPGLIRDHDEAKASPLQCRQLGTDAVVEEQVVGSRGVVTGVDEGAVAVEEERPPDPHRAPSPLAAASSASTTSQRMWVTAM